MMPFRLHWLSYGGIRLRAEWDLGFQDPYCLAHISSYHCGMDGGCFKAICLITYIIYPIPPKKPMASQIESSLKSAYNAASVKLSANMRHCISSEDWMRQSTYLPLKSELLC
ncbi:hypothetical protein CHS0354_010851 [Potamilus streckersoni]|uniref:Uncharacterized protein n=1 Tax=Potamilus streckersoni TaxID=2493646 RepID=A0AAE0TAJ6_9BIVA|nr:hypothetical protein CHS0354_010851 [Potamilus streckersoni]